MNERTQWLHHFIKWFFNASPLSDDEWPQYRLAAHSDRRVNRLTNNGDRRLLDDAPPVAQHADKRNSHS